MNQPSPSNLDLKIEALTDQIGRMTEGITEFKLEIQRNRAEFRADLAELKSMIQAQAEISRQQAATTDRLVGVVETLIQR
jgi:hypothetical protein